MIFNVCQNMTFFCSKPTNIFPFCSKARYFNFLTLLCIIFYFANTPPPSGFPRFSTSMHISCLRDLISGLEFSSPNTGMACSLTFSSLFPVLPFSMRPSLSQILHPASPSSLFFSHIYYCPNM